MRLLLKPAPAPTSLPSFRGSTRALRTRWSVREQTLGVGSLVGRRFASGRALQRRRPSSLVGVNRTGRSAGLGHLALSCSEEHQPGIDHLRASVPASWHLTSLPAWPP